MPVPTIEHLIYPHHIVNHPFPTIKRLPIAYPAHLNIPNHDLIWDPTKGPNLDTPNIDPDYPCRQYGLEYLGRSSQIDEAEPDPTLSPAIVEHEAYMCETWYLLIIRECGYPPAPARFVIAIDTRTHPLAPLMGCWAHLVLAFDPNNPNHLKYLNRIHEAFPRALNPDHPSNNDLPDDLDITIRQQPHAIDPAGDPDKYR